MALKFVKPRGTLDVLPGDSWKWHYVEAQIHRVARLYGYREIRLPTFESTELYTRGVGEGTDIVSKEMYTFTDKGGRSVTLRPEGTAGVVRATLENGLLAASPLPLKSYYIESHFRYEKAQKGRYREHHQFGIECYGAAEPAADVEVMAVAHTLLGRFGLAQAASLEINSIGCPVCRPGYLNTLIQYFISQKSELCDTCLERLDKNPMRLLDCKEDRCSRVARGAPRSLDYLCAECEEHFAGVQALLGEAGISFSINPAIVRGLDYYTKTVFEFVAQGIGTQGTVCGGGRYDGLVEELGGQPTPGVGFGMGLERFIMLLEETGRLPAPPPGPAVYFVGLGDKGAAAARALTAGLRALNIPAECDISGRSVKAQMKHAGRLGAGYTMVLGGDEVASGSAVLKRMEDGAEAEVSLDGGAQKVVDEIARQRREAADAQARAAETGIIGSAEGPVALFSDA